MSLTSAANTTTGVLQAWLGTITAMQPLIALGLVLGKDIVDLYKRAHPETTDADLNVILTAIVAASDSERAEIAKERAAAQAEIDARPHEG